MSLNCLRSFCSKICESCSLNICNSSKYVMLVGKTEDATLNGALTSGNLGLLNIISQLGGQLGDQFEFGIQLTPARSVRTLDMNQSTELRDISIRAAIVQTSLRETWKLKQAHESFEDGWNKFLLAQAECNMNLEVMCKEADPLSKADVNKLRKAVNRVAKYHLSAIYLWKIFCENNFDVANIKRHNNIKDAQVIFVKKQLKKKHKYKSVDDFWKLDIEVQKAFFDGAVKYFKESIHDYCRLVRTFASQVTPVQGQKSNDNYLHDQVIKRVQDTPRGVPQLGEHKGEERAQIGFDSTYLAVSPFCYSSGVTILNPDPSTQRSTQFHPQSHENSMVVRSGVVTPEASVRGNPRELGDQRDQEDASLVPKQLSVSQGSPPNT